MSLLGRAARSSSRPTDEESTHDNDYFDDDESQLRDLPSKYKRHRDKNNGRIVIGRSSEEIGEQGTYVLTDKKTFDQGTHPSAGDCFNDLFEAPVTISGPGKDMPILRTFEEMNLNEALMRSLERKNYTRPLPIQQFAFSLISKGFDLIANAPTGSGKTDAFLIPIIDSILKLKQSPRINLNRSDPRCVIISPVKELAEQLFRVAEDLCYQTSCRVNLSFGGMSRARCIREIRQGCDIVIVTVGRLCDYVQNDVFSLNNLRYLVFDEADELLQRTEGFVDDIRRNIVPLLPTESSEVCKLFFSATDTAELDRLAKEVFKCNPSRLKVGETNTVNAMVKQRIIEIAQYDKQSELLRIMYSEYGSVDVQNVTGEKKPKPPKTIVFVNTRRKCNIIACFLSLNGFKAYPLHGGLTPILRRQSLNAFESDECQVLVATDASARGIDFKDISHVINYDVPNVHCWESYIHRVGRTGRVGNHGRATTFYSPVDDSAMAPYLYHLLRQTNEPIPDFLEREMISEVRTNEFRRRVYNELANLMS